MYYCKYHSDLKCLCVSVSALAFLIKRAVPSLLTTCVNRKIWGGNRKSWSQSWEIPEATSEWAHQVGRKLQIGGSLQLHFLGGAQGFGRVLCYRGLCCKEQHTICNLRWLHEHIHECMTCYTYTCTCIQSCLLPFCSQDSLQSKLDKLRDGTYMYMYVGSSFTYSMYVYMYCNRCTRTLLQR